VLGVFPSPLQMKQIFDAAALPNVCRWSPCCFVKSLSQVCGWGAVFSMVVRLWFIRGGLLVVFGGSFLLCPFAWSLSKMFFFLLVKDIRSVVSESI